MKSLILNRNGCTVFDSQGQIVFRADNYDIRCAHEVFLMDLKGNVLFTILRKKYKLSRAWEGFRSNNDQKEPNFRVRLKACRIHYREALTYEVMLGLDQNHPYSHRIETSTWKSSFCKILDLFGGIVAELRRKKASCGVDLGEVLSMVGEPNIDLSLITGLAVAYCLIDCKM